MGDFSEFFWGETEVFSDIVNRDEVEALPPWLADGATVALASDIALASEISSSNGTELIGATDVISQSSDDASRNDEAVSGSIPRASR